jgi:hypothetical protein
MGTSVLSDLMLVRDLNHTIQLIVVSQRQPFFMLDENLRANPFSCWMRTALQCQPFFMMDVKSTHFHQRQPFFMLDDEISCP